MIERQTVSVRARFERFPATVKGAFLIRGEDADPHLVVLREARIVPVVGQGGKGIGLQPVTLDVAPHRDVFVPFEFSVSDLPPGWYGLDCDLDVDGTPGTYPGGRRFVVAWPRATVRRGTVKVERSVALEGAGKVRVAQVECTGDSIKVHLVTRPPSAPTVRLSAGGEAIPVLDEEFDEETGHCKVTAYPIMRTHGTLRIELSVGRKAKETLEVPLD